jgi:tripartite-type tricarboxylate transporter receptor subunit TctC
VLIIRLYAARLVLSAAAAMLAFSAAELRADEPFYKGKRLTVMINYGAGGPADIEGRLFARHIGKHIEGNPQVIVQNIDGAGGLIGTT